MVATAFVAIFYVVLIISVTPVILFCLLTGLREPLMAIGLWSARLSLRVLGIEVEVSGRERIDPRTPSVFMPNHASFIDGPLVLTLIPGHARAIVKKSILQVPIAGTAMRHAGFVPVDRKGAERGKRSISRAVSLMRSRGYSFLVFPEGTRTRDGRLGPFRRGGFFLALESGAPIVPVTITGTRELMPKGQWFARPGRVRVAFFEPIPAIGATLETMSGLMETVRTTIQGDHDPGSGPGGRSEP